MSPWIVAVVVIVVYWGWSLTHPAPIALVPAAVKSGNLTPVLTALAKIGPGSAPTEYDRVLKGLWNGYHRAEAAQVARDFAMRHKEAPVSQYWLRKLMEHEPAIANRTFDEAFLAQYFDPNVAAGCGKCGSCSCK